MEPERKIEKLLRAFAKKRREQAGEAMEMRPAARQRLHGEIRHRSQQPNGGGFFFRLFTLWRPKLALAFCILAVIGTGLWVVLPLRPHEKSAQTLSLASANTRQIYKPVNEEAKSPAAEPPPAEMPALSPEPAAAPPPAVVVAPGSTDANAVAPPPAIAAGSVLAANNASAPPVVNSDEKLNYQATSPAVPQPVGRLENTAGAINRRAEGSRNGAVTDSVLAKKDLQTTVAPGSPGMLDTNLLLGMNQSPPRGFGGIAGAVDKETGNIAMTPAAVIAPKRSLWTAGPTSAATPATFAFKNEAAMAHGGVEFDSLAKQDSSNGAPPSQHFYRVDLPAVRDRTVLALRNPAPILTSFRIEQNGSELRVLDADGSIYTGAVQVARDQKALDDSFATTLKTEAAASAAAKPSSRTESLSPVRNYFFVVSGTNRNLKQMVTFSGNFIPLTNVAPVWTNTFLSGAVGSGGSAPNSPVPLLLNSRISGKAVIGTGKAIDVNATPSRR